MKKNSLHDLYNPKYAAGYNEKFLTNPFSKSSSDRELELLQGLITPDTKWLDAGCGTGYYLGHFPGIQRAGLDITPSMLEEAKKASPDALFFREGDFRNDIPEWHHEWSLISCMWYPYSYLESIGEFETMLTNFIHWLKPGGDLFLPVADLYDLRPLVPHVPYNQYEEVTGGSIAITSYTWTWIQDNNEGTHVNMVAPHVDHVIQLLEPYFDTIEIARYPPFYDGWVSRRAIVAKGRRASVITGQKANITWHPVPPSINGPYQTLDTLVDMVQVDTLGAASHKQLFREIFSRIKSGRLLKSLGKKILGRS